ncbi:MFS transporter [Ancylomarina sp. 16SWW S1-10-2]|uniref:MFS transporter n=1 Tax=Ancylomarina sp. 16SWW S1-10-2 TaxID=2499681 RepID=UPI0012AE6F07|nr:MFS transporter [Ancylomarina sp. 16SWW S1-10-2]MRT92000.1 MFS transporter [Ancylomarina sp. 16SWW S1-10-2]
MGNSKTNYTVPFAIMSFLLFLLGFVTWINNILVPFMKTQFSITESQAQLVSAAFFSAYIISIPVGGIVKKIGYKKSVIIGSVITGIGCAIFVPALSIGYNMVLGGLFITAIGVVVLQVAANPYVIALGTPETSASRLTLAMAINSSAAVLAPIIGGFIIESSNGNIIVHENMAKIMFIALAGISILTAVILVFMHLPAIEGEEDNASNAGAGRSAWSFPHLILGFLAIGMYMGLEVGVGNYFLNYVEYNVEGKTMAYATMILGFYPAGFFIGRLLGAGLLKKYEASKVLLINSFICVALLGVFFLTRGSSFSIWPLIAQGLFLSIMWSVLFDLSMKDIPAAAAKLGSGIICTGVVFVGIWMFIMGKVVDATGTVLADGTIDAASCNYSAAYLFFFFFYAYIIFFALKGAKIRKQIA